MKRRAVPQGGQAWVRFVLTECYRLTGRWPETARLLYPQGLPPALVAEGERLRAASDLEAEGDAAVEEYVRALGCGA